MSNELKLYHSAASPNSRRVRIFLAEKGIAIPLVPVDLAKGEQRSDAYRAINPRRVVPTLVLEDGTAIGEVLAIWRYLEEVYRWSRVRDLNLQNQAANYLAFVSHQSEFSCALMGCATSVAPF
jgi:glutathione S-transferase